MYRETLVGRYFSAVISSTQQHQAGGVTEVVQVTPSSGLPAALILSLSLNEGGLKLFGCDSRERCLREW